MPAKQQKSKKKNSKRGAGYGPSLGVQTAALRIMMPFYAGVSLAEGAAGQGVLTTYSLNNAYDPVTGLGGKQPLGFDQYSQFYGRFRVLSCVVEVEFANLATQAALVGVVFSAQSTMPSDPDAWPVQRDGWWAAISPNSGGKDVIKFKRSYTFHQILGVTKQEYDSDMDFAGTPSGSPSRIAYCHVWARGGSIVSNVASHFTSRMLTEWSQPVALSLS